MKKLEVFNYAISNSGNDSVDIHIDGVIVDAQTQQIMRDWWGDETSVSYKSFRDQVLASKAKTINVYVNSYGGHIGDAMAIHDMLTEEQAKGKTVNTKGRGIIASAATFILMAGNSEMSANSWFMIHNASGAIEGDVNVIETYAKVLRQFNDRVRDFYASATGMRKEDVTKMMDAETWLTSTDAKAKGFVKNVTSSASFKNLIQSDAWCFKNTAVLNQYNSFVKKDIQMEIGAFQRTLIVAQAESFTVTDGGFLLEEAALNNIEAALIFASNLEEANASLMQGAEEANAALEAGASALASANDTIAALNLKIEELGKGDAKKPSAAAGEAEIVVSTEKTGWDKYRTSADEEMENQRKVIKSKF
jgi:ATP-dependent Clp endopeptidase proteolytic subunit ClpP